MKYKLLIPAVLAAVSFNCYGLNPVIQTTYTAVSVSVVDAETMEAGIKTKTGSATDLLAGSMDLTVYVDRPGVKISPTLYGIFVEEINRAGDGGIYAEMVQNRTFEDDAEKPVAWTLVQSEGTQGAMSLDTADPLNQHTPHSLKLEITRVDTGGRMGVCNAGFKGMSVKEGSHYNLALHARCSDGFAGPVQVTLESADERILARQTLSTLTPQWQKLEVALVSSATDCSTRLVISSGSPGTLWLDVVSLFPQETWKGRKNGLRPDLMAMLEKMKPAFVRFPGGCFVEGDMLENAFRCKKTIGDIAERPGHWNRWGYRSTDGLGMYEYLQMTEDLKAEPLFVINCGMSHMEQPGKREYREGSGLSEAAMQEYVQDALDAIEYCNGPTDSKWGAMRAKAGHPEPFGLKYIEIGNENGGPMYKANFALMCNAIKSRYPQMQVIANEWWGKSGPDRCPDPATFDLLDEHELTSPLSLIKQVNRFDKYPRDSYRVYVGEYASTWGDCGTGNLYAALCDAAFMTGMERNSDVVVMASYAPLFCNVSEPFYKRWNPNAICFDNSRVYGTPSYHVQVMFSTNRGDTVLPVQVNEAPELHASYPGQVGVGTHRTKAEFKDIRVEKDGKVLYQSDFTKGTQGWKLDAKKWSVIEGALRQTSMDADVHALVGDKTWTDYTYSVKARKIEGDEGFILTVQSGGQEPQARLNLGGLGNRRHDLVDAPTVSPMATPGTIETGRWYDIRIEVKGVAIRCYLDGQLIIDAARTALMRVYATASRETTSDDVILKVVNAGPYPKDAAVKLQGIRQAASVGKAIVLTSGSRQDENSLDQPERVAPKETAVTGVGPNFRYTFAPHSVTILRVPVGRN
jgi:alpha-L-arabinofuranosidase